VPRVSVIINVYNGEATLRETIDSVLNQSCTDWELIVWDDCSTDGSVAIVRDYGESRIKHFVSDRNRGLGPSRFAALEHASGQWFAFVDQDDVWTKEKLALQLARAEADPEAGFVYGRAVKFFQNGKRVDYDHRHEYGPLPEGDIFESLFVDSCFIAISTVLFSRRAFEAVPPLPGYISACPDYFLFLAIARKYRVAAVQEPICHYRIHAGNMSHSHGQRMQHEILRLIDDWSHALSPKLTAKRRRVHSTVLAVHQMRSPRTFFAGVHTLLKAGGVLYLLSRPFVRAYRGIRRRLVTPYWQRADLAGGELGIAAR
jgi:glycosyltransferase involved in cell wall biosynthesis